MILDKMKKRQYSVVEYNPAWSKKFDEIKKELSSVFGSKALNIQHVGSTSIQGVSSKPVIDVLITVSQIESLDDEKQKMVDIGYQWGENYIEPNSLLFFKEKEDESKTENIHICIEGSPKAIQFVTTRDYLRAHPERAKAYGDLKIKLKEKYFNDYPTYRAGKKSFQDETERLTQAWIQKK